MQKKIAPGVVSRISDETSVAHVTENWLLPTFFPFQIPSLTDFSSGNPRGCGVRLFSCWARDTWATSNVCSLGTDSLSDSCDREPHSSLGWERTTWCIYGESFTSPFITFVSRVTSEGRRVVTSAVIAAQRKGTTRGQPSVGSSCLSHT